MFQSKSFDLMAEDETRKKKQKEVLYQPKKCNCFKIFLLLGLICFCLMCILFNVDFSVGSTNATDVSNQTITAVSNITLNSAFQSKEVPTLQFRRSINMPLESNLKVQSAWAPTEAMSCTNIDDCTIICVDGHITEFNRIMNTKQQSCSGSLTVTLSGCTFEDDKDGGSLDATHFNGNYKLRNLTIDGGDLVFIFNNAFKNAAVASLETLILLKTKIYSLGKKTFAHLSKLEYFTLINQCKQLNAIHFLDPVESTLKKATIIEESDKDFDPAKWIGGGTSFTALTFLNLSGNRFPKTLTGETFKNLKAVQTLILKNCSIESLGSSTFDRLVTTLRVLDLSLNKISVLSGDFLMAISENGLRVYLHGNPWNCTCDNALLINELKKSPSGVDDEDPVCFLPDDLAGVDLRCISLQCGDEEGETNTCASNNTTAGTTIAASPSTLPNVSSATTITIFSTTPFTTSHSTSFTKIPIATPTTTPSTILTTTGTTAPTTTYTPTTTHTKTPTATSTTNPTSTPITTPTTKPTKNTATTPHATTLTKTPTTIPSTFLTTSFETTFSTASSTTIPTTSLTTYSVPSYTTVASTSPPQTVPDTPPITDKPSISNTTPTTTGLVTSTFSSIIVPSKISSTSTLPYDTSSSSALYSSALASSTRSSSTSYTRTPFPTTFTTVAASEIPTTDSTPTATTLAPSSTSNMPDSTTDSHSTSESHTFTDVPMTSTTPWLTTVSDIPKDGIELSCLQSSHNGQNVLYVRNRTSSFKIHSESASSVRITVPNTTTNHFFIHFNSISALKSQKKERRPTNNCIGTTAHTDTVISGLRAEETYVFCMIPEHEVLVSPFDCNSHLLVNLEDRCKEPWILDSQKAMFISMTVLGFVLFWALGTMFIFLLLRWYPTLLKGSKRLIPLSCAIAKRKMLLIPKDYEPQAEEYSILDGHTSSNSEMSIPSDYRAFDRSNTSLYAYRPSAPLYANLDTVTVEEASHSTRDAAPDIATLYAIPKRKSQRKPH